MALSTAYLVTPKNLDAFLNAIKTAKAPERVNQKFLVNLGFASSNDRLLIGILKALEFTDDSGVPTNRYFQFLDQSRSGVVLADAIRDAYSDLFAINTKAEELSPDDVKNKLRTLTQGQFSDNVLGLMAKTFSALAELADWQAPVALEKLENEPNEGGKEHPIEPQQQISRIGKQEHIVRHTTARLNLRELHYNIQIVLPETRDIAVFDAIFECLNKHLVT
jgi:hypothetical protein